MKYVIGNWKANKNHTESANWIETFQGEFSPNEQVTLVICPPFPFLSLVRNALKGFPQVFIGAQNVSLFEEGSYTGEVTAKTLKEIVSFAIIGHSERRKNFHETDEELTRKVQLAKKYNLEPIYCVRDEKDPIPAGVTFVAYEPVAAIGTGQNEPPEKVIEMKKKMHLPDNCVFIYGGSVNETNISSYLQTGEIDGFLVGKASLDAHQFLAMAKAIK